jgi:hypothetical protein
MHSGLILPIFWRNLLPPSSGSTDTPSSQQEACSLACRWLLDLSFDPEDGGNTFLQNIGQLVGIVDA